MQNSPFNTASVAGSASAGLKIATTTLSLGGLTGSNSFESRFNTTSSVLYGGLTALTFNTPANATLAYSGGLADNGNGMTLTKNGAGTQYLSGTLGYTGATAVNAGFLGSDSTLSGPVTVANGAGLAPGASAGAFGTFTISNAGASALTLNGGNLLMDVSTASNDLIAVTGTTVLNGTNTVLPNMTTGVANGTYTLATYGSKTGSGSVVFANGSTTLGNATLSVNAGNIQMTVAGGALNHSEWKGTGTSAAWNTTNTFWTRNGTATQTYVAGDFVTINDTATATTITGDTTTFAPASVTVDNTTKNFTISAIIAGTGTPLVKLGSGTLTLSGTNTYTGGTFIGGGRVGITSNANLGDAAGTITFNGGELYITNDFSSARNVILNAVAGNRVLLQGNADWTNSGAFTGDGGITFRQNPNGGTSATLTSLSNDFKGALGIEYGNSGMTVKIRSMADSATANGNIIFGIGSTANTGGAGQIFEWDSAAGSALTLDNRSIEFGQNGSAWGTIKNSHATNAITINTDLVVSGTGAKTLVLEAVNTTPSNVFDGDIGNGSGTVEVIKAGSGTWTLSGNNSYTGATTISAGTLVGIGANAFGSTSGISLTGSNTLSLRGDTSTAFASSNVTTTATGPTINADQATIAGTGAKTMTIGTIGTTSVAATWQLNFTGANNTSLSAGTVTTPTTASVTTHTISNSISGGGSLTLAGVAGGGTTTGTLAFSGNGDTTVTGAITQAGTAQALTKSGNGTLTLQGTNSYTGATNVNAGIMEIALGGSTHASSAFTVSTSGTALVVNGTINGTLAANSSTTISGSGTVVGAATVSGNLNPGNSPGELNFSSSLAMANSTVTTMEINGTTLGLNYDNIDVGTALTYDGALTLAIGATFGSSAVFDLFEFGSQTNSFDSVSLTGSYGNVSLTNLSGVWGATTNSGNETWSFSQTTGDLTLTVIPEPRAALLGGLGLLMLLRRRR